MEIYECDVCGYTAEYTFDPDAENPDHWGEEHGGSAPSQCSECREQEDKKNSHRETDSTSSSN